MTLSGDMAALRAERVLYISNHQSSVDWVIVDSLAMRACYTAGLIRYMLKHELHYLPLYGWYFAAHGCVYVRRGRGNFHEERARRDLRRLTDEVAPSALWLVIFPEGTRYTGAARQLGSSRTYARTRKLAPPELQYVLCPRVTGMHLALDALRDRLDAVYDVTIAYSQSRGFTGGRVQAPSMFDFVCCPSGQRVHIDVRRVDISEVPREREELER